MLCLHLLMHWWLPRLAKPQMKCLAPRKSVSIQRTPKWILTNMTSAAMCVSWGLPAGRIQVLPQRAMYKDHRFLIDTLFSHTFNQRSVKLTQSHNIITNSLQILIIRCKHRFHPWIYNPAGTVINQHAIHVRDNVSNVRIVSVRFAPRWIMKWALLNGSCALNVMNTMAGMLLVVVLSEDKMSKRVVVWWISKGRESLSSMRFGLMISVRLRRIGVSDKAWID